MIRCGVMELQGDGPGQDDRERKTANDELPLVPRGGSDDLATALSSDFTNRRRERRPVS